MPTLDDKIQWALIHGIAMGVKTSDTELDSKMPVIHAPFTLDSFPFPKKEFEKAVNLARDFNILVENITRNPEWLISTLKATSISDLFIRKLITIYETVLGEGTKQTLSLAINRSDYMLHSKEGDVRSLLQVELNTIASSFGSLSTKISEMHREMSDMEQQESVARAIRNIPRNSALDNISGGIAAAHFAYLGSVGQTKLDNVVAVVVQPGERNFADQRLLQCQLWNDHRVRCVRVTLAEIFTYGTLGSNDELSIRGKNISVVYFRAGYSPEDHPSDKEWDARLLIERSIAIKCPTIAVHLAGCKKVQQVLADPGVLEMFISSESQCVALRSVFAGLYNLAVPSTSSANAPAELEQLTRIKKEVERVDGLNFVLKPQREGGGNNFYGPAVAAALQSMSLDEQAAYILMERILPPSSNAELVRDGKVNQVCGSWWRRLRLHPL